MKQQISLQKILVVFFSIVLLISIIIYLFFNTKTSWSSRDEWNGPSIQTCSYKGLWIRGIPFQIIFYKSCGMI